MTSASPATTAAANDAPIDAVEAEFATLFNRVRGAMKDYAAQLDPELTVANYRIISTLERIGPVHAGGLAETLEMDKSVLSRQLAMLSTMGLLTRTPDPRDGRSSFLAVTDETARRLQEIRSGSKATLHEALRSWPDGDVSTLAELLHRINALPL
ncbi:winged helix-turn-helix transcriptional regulator [Microbacteriaceae bacterium VKM Ac-2855]|nr:winged helix-turn-helix transcriptional regulator [Microbacteriaceae bacterium VKM Ac-2855]